MGSRHQDQDARGRRPAAQRGQAFILVALALTVFCGMLALAVDVGVTTTRDQALRHAANTAAYAGAYALYGQHVKATTALTDTAVWNTLATTLNGVGLSVANAPGGAVPADPCAARYRGNQVAMRAAYVAPNDDVITTNGTSPWLVGSGSIPGLASGVQVTLGACQSAGFGAVLGHPTYTIWVTGLAGGRLPGPDMSPTPPPITGTQPVPEPYSISGAPNGNCNGVDATANVVPPAANGDTQQFYCPGVYAISSTVTLFANGAGLGNNYGYDNSFKGYIGGVYNPGQVGEVRWLTGGGGGGLSACPTWMVVPIITGVDHTGHASFFVILEWATVNVTTCSPSKISGTIVSVYDPSGYGVVGAAPTATPTATPTNTATPAATSTPLPWHGQTSNTTTNTSLKGVACPSAGNGSICDAVGTSGTIVGTTTGGPTWSPQTSGITNTLSGIACPTTSMCYAVGASGTIVVTTDGSATWSSASSGITNTLSGIACPTTSTCYAVGAYGTGTYGTIVGTTNAGAGTGSTWTSQSSGALHKDLYGITCLSASTCYAVGYGGTILATTNGGSTWNNQTVSNTPGLKSVACAGASVCYAVGDQGTIMVTTNAGSGSTWNPWSGSPTGTNLTGIACPSASTCYAVGASGTIMVTNNAGAGISSTWTSQSSGTTQGLNGITCTDISTCYAVGDAPNGGTGTIVAYGSVPPPTPTPLPTSTPTATATNTPTPVPNDAATLPMITVP